MASKISRTLYFAAISRMEPTMSLIVMIPSNSLLLSTTMRVLGAFIRP